MGARQYDHDLIRTLAEGTPDPVNYIEVIHNEYTRKHGEGSIDPREIRRIIYLHHKKWFGVPAPEAKRGRPPKHDEERLLSIRDREQHVGMTTLARMYNCGWTGTPMPVQTVKYILRKYGRR